MYALRFPLVDQHKDDKGGKLDGNRVGDAPSLEFFRLNSHQNNFKDLEMLYYIYPSIIFFSSLGS